MECFLALEEILHTSQIKKRFSLFDLLYDSLPQMHWEHSSPIRPIQDPIYAKQCKILHPRKISRPKHINTDSTMAQFLHSLAHIEYCAIDLALDATYRFRNLPIEFYLHWLEVAKEEITHFCALRRLLQNLGYDYGDFPVHNNLFEAMKSTPKFADRMALVHRGMEAGGLDANPFVSQKVRSSTHPLQTQILEILEVILRDEISHVRKGDYWWKFSKDPRSFATILETYGYTLPKVLNIQARLQCGFTLAEIEELQSQNMKTKSF